MGTQGTAAQSDSPTRPAQGPCLPLLPGCGSVEVGGGAHPSLAALVTLHATRWGQNFPKPSGGWILLSRDTTCRCLILPLQGDPSPVNRADLPPCLEKGPGEGPGDWDASCLAALCGQQSCFLSEQGTML